MEIEKLTREAARMANSDSPDETARGLAMITEIFSDRTATNRAGSGFVDNALFEARKRASHQDAAVRNETARMLITLFRANPRWADAAAETAEEIAMQPSDGARTVAENFFKATGGRK